MPKENHYWSGQVEHDGRAPDLTIRWGQTPTPQALINDNPVTTTQWTAPHSTG